ncbi:type VI secretion system Vgr family protein [Spirosoma jeollabukense]
MPSTTQLIATADVTINGIQLPRFNSIYLNQPFESHHTFEISLSPDMLPNRTAVVRLNDLADSFVGEQITIRFKQGMSVGGKVNGQQGQLFRGIVTSVRLSRSQSSTTSVIISGSSPTILLCAGKTIRSFTDMTLKDIVSKLTGAAGLTSKIDPDLTVPFSYTAQYEEDEYTFLQRKAQTWGEWMYYDGETFIFGKKARPSVPPVALTLGVNLFDMEYALRVTPLNSKWLNDNFLDNTKNQAPSSSPVDGLQTSAKIAADKSEKLFNVIPTMVNPGLHSSSSLQDVAKRNKAKQANELAVLQGRTPEMELRVGGLVKIKEGVYDVADAKLGAVKLDTIDYGQFIVTRLTHYVDARGVYQATFEAIPEAADHPPVEYNVPPYVLRTDLAIVKDINDPDELGRVKLQFSWQKDDNQTTDWVTLSHPMSGKDRGVYFIPELEENVWVDYMFGDPDFPFVISSWYHLDAKPGELYNKENNIKGIVTRSGNHIVLNDESGKESIKIYNKDKKNSIELSLDGTHITIKSNGNINLQAGGEINMSAGGNISIESKKNVAMLATDSIDMVTDTGDIDLISGKKLTLIAGTDLAESGKTIDISSDTTAAVKASVALTLDGGPSTTIKGGMVMIN